MIYFFFIFTWQCHFAGRISLPVDGNDLLGVKTTFNSVVAGSRRQTAFRGFARRNVDYRRKLGA